jgi:methyltransferase (TIGR00027 family)
LESERPDALFRDLFARRLAGERGRRIAEGMPALPGTYPGPRGVTWFFSVRTKTFDELILESIESVNADAVLNLAAGLDARPYRLQLPSSLVWIEADRAEILDAKAEVLAGEKPACRVERIAVELADASARQHLFDRIGDAHERVVVVTEGFLVYLEEGTVSSLADELRARISMRRWVLESAAPEVLKRNMRAWGSVLTQGHAEWKFASPNGFEFFRPHGWSPKVERSFFAEARRLGREEGRHMWLLRAMAALSKRFKNAVIYGVLQPSP